LKYRRLDLSELEKFRQEFISLLVVNGIEAADWIAIKENEPVRASKLVEAFSDAMFDSVFSKTNYLQFTTTNEIFSFHFMESLAELFHIKSQNPNHNFLDDIPAHMIWTDLEIKSTQKTFRKSRELEIFGLMESGAVPTDGSFHNKIKSVM
jgi:hypothetical protein